MNAQLLIKENNEKRKQLNKENKEFYEDMLLYIRLSFDKSDLETEEILMELLDHLVEAQNENRTAKDLFGDNPRAYANEIIGELPAMITKKRVLYVLMGIFNFLAVAAFINGLVHTVLHYAFGLFEPVKTFYLGSVTVLTVLSLAIAFTVLYVFMQYMRWTCFKHVSKLKEFWLGGLLFGVLPFGCFFLLIATMPDFGPAITFPLYWLIVLGVALYMVGFFFKKRI